jgi:hypothetical protein
MNILDRLPDITRKAFEAHEKPVFKEKEPDKKEPSKYRPTAIKALEKLHPDYLDQFAKDAGVSEAIKLREQLIKDLRKYDLNQ